MSLGRACDRRWGICECIRCGDIAIQNNGLIYSVLMHIYIYTVHTNSSLNNSILSNWHECNKIFLIFLKLIPTTLSQLLFSHKNTKWTSTATHQHQHSSAWTTSDRLVYNRLQTVLAQILMTLMNRRNILAPRMAMAVMVNVRLLLYLLINLRIIRVTVG
jgi:hypothetical protein